MAKFGKWIGGGLGWAFAGPIGAIIGFAIGSYIDESQSKSVEGSQGGDFDVSLLVLAAAVIKADKKVSQHELEYVKRFFTQNFGEAHAQQRMEMLQEILNQDIPLQDVCDQIRGNMNYYGRLQLLHFLFGIAKADGEVDDVEAKVIEQISAYMKIKSEDFESIKAIFYGEGKSEAAYKILEVDPEASDEEIKKAYRKMAVKYHPDKVGHLGEEAKKGAKEKFQKVQDAYDKIKRERGMN